MASVRKEDQIPAGPFRDFLNARLAHWERALNGDDTQSGVKKIGAQRMVCEELGWPDESGIRKLYRMRNGLRGVGRNKSSKDVPTEYFSRPVVEDALHHAGVAFADLYPDLVDDLEPVEGSCPRHGERVFLDAEGECQWCAGEREFAERLARRAREQSWARERNRKQAA